MERAMWTDERLDDLARRMDAGFERVDRDMRELRADVRAMRMDLSGQIDAVRVTMLRVGGGMIVALLGMVAALIARGG
jgi:hypothetical protein